LGLKVEWAEVEIVHEAGDVFEVRRAGGPVNLGCKQRIASASRKKRTVMRKAHQTGETRLSSPFVLSKSE
jgi:hypothetical protein